MKDFVRRAFIKECCKLCGNLGYISMHSVLSCSGCGVYKFAEKYGLLPEKKKGESDGTDVDATKGT